MLDVASLLKSLATRRPLFHSEADFQHEFAWEIRARHPDWAVRLEVPFLDRAIGTTDIVVHRPDGAFGIELKYLTKRLHCNHGGEAFHLRAQGGTDLRRYDVLRDVQRLERLNGILSGPSYVVVLTNDPAYWRAVTGRVTIDADFRLDHGRVLTGPMKWAAHAGAGTVRSREAAIELAGRYELAWGDYSALEGASGAFRYLCVEVPGAAPDR